MGLVGEDAQDCAFLLQPIQRLGHPGKRTAMVGQVRAIMVEEQFDQGGHLLRAGFASGGGKSLGNERFGAESHHVMQGGGVYGGTPARRQSGVGRVQQVGRGIHQGTVQIEDQSGDHKSREGRIAAIYRRDRAMPGRFSSGFARNKESQFVSSTCRRRDVPENMDRAAIVLAAGAGTRMKSATPKVLHQVAGLPILGHVIAGLKGAGVSRIVVVTAPGADQVRAYATSLGADSVVQDKQLGTGHAAAAAGAALKNFKGEVMVAYGDMPLLTGEAFAAAFAARPKDGLAIVAFHAADPGAYGRVLLDKDGMLDRIVEFKDASVAERKIDLCNAGLMVAEAASFFALAAKLDNKNAQGEFYLTDIPELAKKDGARCAVAQIGETEALGVNSRAELAQAEWRMQDRLRDKALAAGVTMTAPETVFLSHDTVLDADVEIEPFVVLGVGVTVKSGARIRSHSHLEGAVVEARAVIGPFARLRPGAAIGEGAHIGNFVEVKNSAIGAGTKANHLTYLGDATVGADVNIGAGTITCNYDGFGKYRTEIGDGAFIGSDTALVAPVKVGAGAITGAGSVITKDVAPDALAVARGSQTEKPGWAKLFRDLKRKKRDQA